MLYSFLFDNILGNCTLTANLCINPNTNPIPINMYNIVNIFPKSVWGLNCPSPTVVSVTTLKYKASRGRNPPLYYKRLYQILMSKLLIRITLEILYLSMLANKLLASVSMSI